MNFSRAPGFTGSRIDRADNLRLDEARIATFLGDLKARLLRLEVLDPVLAEDGRLAWGAMTELAEGVTPLFLGLDGGRPLFAPLVRLAPGATQAWSVFGLIDRMEGADAALWATARSLIEWHNRHGFCSVCGEPSEIFRAGWARKCGDCGAEHFPRVDPVVIMLAEHGGKVLVGRGINYPPRRYSALAGFVEPGESIEEAVARELFEEAGVRATSVRYVASQPWPFPASLMIACIAEVESDRVAIDRTELADAVWVDRAQVKAALAGRPDAPFQAPPHFAIANTLLSRWLHRF
ncbi:NAD(+) diphosphatase [Allosphingosinicella sp.]|uniref:NAD(+) diphosphatase n=1 Tax=Allosphingosinicella sp. TaxID=2823234 RepID=UPI002FC0C891